MIKLRDGNWEMNKWKILICICDKAGKSPRLYCINLNPFISGISFCKNFPKVTVDTIVVEPIEINQDEYRNCL